jgi:hypothetical protein
LLYLLFGVLLASVFPGIETAFKVYRVKTFFIQDVACRLTAETGTAVD